MSLLPASLRAALLGFTSRDPADRSNWKTLWSSDLARKVAETFSAEILVFGLNVIVSVFVARSLGPSSKGLYALSGVMAALCAQFGNLGMHASNTYYVAKDQRLLPHLVGNTLAAAAIIGGGTVVLTLSIGYFSPHVLPVEGLLLYFTVCSIPFILATQLMQNLLVGIQEIRTYNRINVGIKLLLLFVTVVLLLLRVVTPVMLCAAGILISAFNLAWIYARLRPHLSGPPVPSKPLFLKSVRYGLKAYISALMAFLVMRIDLLMVNHFLGTTATGLYSLAVGIIGILYMLPNTTGLVIFPRLCQMDSLRQKSELVRRVTQVMGLVLLPATVLLAVVAEPLISVVYGENFSGAALPLIFLMPGFLLVSIESFYRRLIMSDTYRVEIVYSWIAACILNILLNLILIPRLGLPGAAIASSISLGVVAAGTVTIFYLQLHKEVVVP